MGVKGLWKLIGEAGSPTTLESLEAKILAVDVSIWLHQAVHGFKGQGVDATANAHLLTLFHRICKLLFYRIRPVFVFDGGVPQLKKQTMSFRRIRREAAVDRAQQVRQRLLKNLLKSHAVRNVLGRTGPAPAEHKVLPPVKPKQKDMFELPPLPEGETLELDSAVNTETVDEDEHPLKVIHKGYVNLHEFNLESDEFLSLPLQKRHEILVELQDSRKDNSWNNLNNMPADFDDFSSFQMKRLLKRSKFQETIDGVRSKIQKVKADEIEKEMFGDLERFVGQTYRIASEDASHSVVLRRETEEPKVPAIQIEEKSTNKKKGKSLMKNPKDFLTELLNKSVVDVSDDSDSDDDIDDEKCKQEVGEEDESLMKVMNYIMEDENSISQEEILSIIQQTSKEVEEIFPTAKDIHQPSTSKDASGSVPTDDNDSSEESDDDFIEVPSLTDEFTDSVNEELTEQPTKNVDALMSTKANSLYIKIAQQRLDDMLHETQTSPKKAIIDTRKQTNYTRGEVSKKENYHSKQTSKNLENESSLSINFDISKSNKVDDIFADIFKVPVVPKKTVNETLIKKSPKKQKDQITSVKDGENIQNDNLQEKINELVKKQIEDMIQKSIISLPQEKENSTAVDSSDISLRKSDEQKDSKKTEDIVTSPSSLTNDDINELSDEISDEDFIEVTPPKTNKEFNISHNDDLQDEDVPTSSKLQTQPKQLNETKLCIDEDDNHLESNNNPVIEKILPDELVTIKRKPEKGLSSEDDNIMDVAELIEDGNDLGKVPESNPDVNPGPSIDELKVIEEELVEEHHSLVAQASKNDRIASNLSQQTYTDAQELLQLFGLPFIVAPMEAEAQCAFLDSAGLTHGTITDDSDAFLFGSKHIYKNFFNQNKHMEYFRSIIVEQKFGLDREKLICLALLTGSDYTEGIDGVGAVGGMEILTEFSGTGVDILRNFKKWWSAHSSGVSAIRMTKIREKLVQLHIPDGFPNEEVFQAYTEPTVDDSKEKFDWAIPNIEGIREFTAEKFGWSKLKTDEILLPILKKMKVKSSQSRIDSYFQNVTLVKEPVIQSKRLKEAIAKSKGEHVPSPEKKSSKSKAKPKNRMEEIKMEQMKKQAKKRSSEEKMPGQIRAKRAKKVKENSDSVQEEVVVDDVQPEKILSKQEKKIQNYKQLYKKEVISQRKADKEDMDAKKLKAALLLKQKLKN